MWTESRSRRVLGAIRAASTAAAPRARRPVWYRSRLRRVSGGSPPDPHAGPRQPEDPESPRVFHAKHGRHRAMLKIPPRAHAATQGPRRSSREAGGRPVLRARPTSRARARPHPVGSRDCYFQLNYPGSGESRAARGRRREGLSIEAMTDWNAAAQRGRQGLRGTQARASSGLAAGRPGGAAEVSGGAPRAPEMNAATDADYEFELHGRGACPRCCEPKPLRGSESDRAGTAAPRRRRTPAPSQTETPPRVRPSGRALTSRVATSLGTGRFQADERRDLELGAVAQAPGAAAIDGYTAGARAGIAAVLPAGAGPLVQKLESVAVVVESARCTGPTYKERRPSGPIRSVGARIDRECKGKAS
ncbi:hypothetical protein Q5P01_000314 [Channa striata]|uniref:Uncharacterized protein n=1 Tax=Channa striata TaxID=64152 RepID=A0AA88LJ51_CHASR|nr:hypothetical protein Q5P01_000314 [Channa striata]